MREVKNDGQPTPLNAPMLKRRTACDGEFNTYAGSEMTQHCLSFIRQEETE